MKWIVIMFMLHVLDDFVLQPICLSKLKQKKTWEGLGDLYKEDYKCALLIHALSWSCMINLPWMFMADDMLLAGLIIINAAIHYHIDDLKANKGKINLWQDQLCHFAQIIITWLICVLK